MQDKALILWHGKGFDLISETQVLPNGKPVTVEVIRHPGSSAVVPLLGEGKVVMIRQYRPAVGDFLWEIPAGTRIPGEDPLACAKRELCEECGLEGGRFDTLGVIAVAAGYSDERIHLFLATEISPGEQHLDEDELLTTHIFPFDDVMGMIQRGEIHEAMTIVGLQMAYQRWKGNHDRPGFL
jgi:ADP-ribose pyrophosphatase